MYGADWRCEGDKGDEATISAVLVGSTARPPPRPPFPTCTQPSHTSCPPFLACQEPGALHNSASNLLGARLSGGWVVSRSIGAEAISQAHPHTPFTPPSPTTPLPATARTRCAHYNL